MHGNVVPYQNGGRQAGLLASSPSGPSGLTDELARRVQSSEEAQQPLEDQDGLDWTQTTYFCEARHDVGDDEDDRPAQAQGIVSKWRQKERLKTTAVALVLCLNIGVDPPDVIKISPCARLECWVDPLSMQPPKALETIGKNLQAQYERWQPRAKYKMHLDPTMDDVKKLAISCRRTAKNERVLFHYNGHGVPRPTVNGEIWVFNKSYTQYIPMSIYDLQAWVGTPCIYVFDCSAAGLIINSFRAFAEQRIQELEQMPAAMVQAGGYPGQYPPPPPEDPLKECILLASCGATEMLPQMPDLPADVFTACLTTPIKVALRWFCSRSLLRHEGLTKELIDRIPGKQTDRKTPLGELNWIFTAITDTIAWNMLPRALFQRLFRQDLLVASLFRNFLLAERVMRAANCTPVSYPRLPPTHQHPMWQAWDMAAEMCLLQLPSLLDADNVEVFQPSPFFSEQLTAFELWLQYGSKDKKPPEQLPIVLQVLLSQVHRLRALVLLGRFLDMGSWAVDLALSVGIFPYVLKLLQTTAADLRQTLVFIWTKILALDKSCQADLVKDGGHQYFIKYLDSPDPAISPDSRAQAAFVLAVICDGHVRGQQLCAASDLLHTCLNLLLANAAAMSTGASPLLIKWLCLCIGKLCENMPQVAAVALREHTTDMMAKLLLVPQPDIRAAAIFTLGALVQASEVTSANGSVHGGFSSEGERFAAEREVACHLLTCLYDASPLVRAEVAVGIARIAAGHAMFFQDAVHAQQRRAARIMRGGPTEASATSPPSDMGAHSAPSASASSAIERAHAHAHGQSSGSLQASHFVNRGVPQPVTTSAAAGDLASSPGVRPADGGFEPTIGIHTIPSPDSLPGTSAGGVFPSPDAARLGGGLYECLLMAACMLATDPAPRVAKLGKAALRVAHVELAPVPGTVTASPTAAGAMSSPNLSSSLPTMAVPTAAASSLGATAAHNSSAAAKWGVRSWRGTSNRSIASSASTSPSSPNVGPQPADGYGRTSFILRKVNSEVGPGREAGLPRVSSAQSDASNEYPESHRSHESAGGDERAGPSGRTSPASSPPPPALPASLVYKSSCEFFSWPLLGSPNDFHGDALSGLGTGLGSHHPSTMASHDPARTAIRMRERALRIAKCKGAGRGAKLKDNVVTIDTEAPSTSALLLHPFRKMVTLVDGRGFVRCFDHTRSPPTITNKFHVASGEVREKGLDAQPTTIVSLYQLNELYSGLLLAGAADGAVRVWRDYVFKGQQRLATAWQAVPLPQMPSSSGTGRRAVYEWSEQMGALYAAGGNSPGAVHIWSLAQELCVDQVHVRSSMNPSASLIVDHLAVSREEPLLLAGCSNGAVMLYDLRNARHPAASVNPHTSPMIGMALEPGGVSNQLVTGAANGELKFIDFRMAGDSAAQMGVWKTVEAHSKGGMTALTAHPHAPLLATVTASQVVKLWSPRGEQQGVIRAHSSLLVAQRMGPVTCLAFHPYALQLASGGADSVVALYPIEASAEG
ncbi:hypothetical protein WJX72_000593 [[Myrmecia] bisecta]|uniref:Raptor N-terminal CASPase-like domain-containing protein n=1 Tax=[Myrmecia] bisecta TaxID=41462 RepID=A0AAW1QE25_9CHLO